jgi:hypothetical protein
MRMRYRRAKRNYPLPCTRLPLCGRLGCRELLVNPTTAVVSCTGFCPFAAARKREQMDTEREWYPHILTRTPLLVPKARSYSPLP